MSPIVNIDDQMHFPEKAIELKQLIDQGAPVKTEAEMEEVLKKFQVDEVAKLYLEGLV